MATLLLELNQYRPWAGEEEQWFTSNCSFYPPAHGVNRTTTGLEWQF